MPGMMDTVLNLGLNDETVAGPRQAVAATSASPGTAIAASSRCTRDVVLERRATTSSRKRSSARKRSAASTCDTELAADDWRAIVADYKEIVEKRSGKPFPQDPREQLWGAIGAVFGSWMNQRAITYRRLHDIPESWGTAVNVQAMVFGNMGDDCAHRRRLHARSLDRREACSTASTWSNAQGEDVVAGIRTPQPITIDAQAGAEVRRAGDGRGDARGLQAARRRARTSSRRTTATCRTSSSRSQRGKLYMLQTRNGKRTAEAALQDRGRHGRARG